MIYELGEILVQIDLLKKYNTNGCAEEIREKFNDERKKKIPNFTETNEKFSVGEVITFFGGYNYDIWYSTEILGFDTDGGIYLLWDCYWFPIKDDSERLIEKVI